MLNGGGWMKNLEVCVWGWGGGGGGEGQKQKTCPFVFHLKKHLIKSPPPSLPLREEVRSNGPPPFLAGRKQGYTKNKKKRAKGQRGGGTGEGAGGEKGKIRGEADT